MGDNLIAEYSGAGTLLKKYIFGPGIDEPVCMIDVAAGNARYYYHYDGQGNVVALTNSVRNVIEKYSYDVFGTPTAASSIGNPYMFTGREYDFETDNYCYRARYYKPSIGRFLQTDPFGYSAGINWYTYCGNNPINFVDSLGLCKKYTELSEEEFYSEMNKKLADLAEIDPSEALNLFDYLFADTEYYQGGNKDILYELLGELYEGSELNYYYIGAVMKRDGYSIDSAINLMIAWKIVGIVATYPSSLIGLIDSDDVYHMPTEGEWKFMVEGYTGYNGPIYDPMLNLNKPDELEFNPNYIYTFP